MSIVTLVFSVHTNHGNCNSTKLFSILENIDPDVIFEEISFSLYTEKYEKQGNEILEIQALKMYLQKKSVILVDVDTPGLTTEQDKYYTKMTEDLYRISSKYRILIDKQYKQECEKGFEFINSSENDKVISEILNEMRKSNNKDIITNTKMWEDLNEKRECDMLKRIIDYCSNNKFNKAAFIIGSGHRDSIIKRIEENCSEDGVKIKWDFLSFDL
jgi:hypothetical protein